MAVINKTNSIMEFPLQISRQYGAPIERYSGFYNQVDAETYATTSPLAYVGQIIAIVDEGTSTSTAYIISKQTDKKADKSHTGKLVYAVCLCRRR